MYKTVLVATDGSESASRAVTTATDLAALCGASLHIVNVYQKSRQELRVSGMQMAYPEGIDRGSVAETQAEAAASLARSNGVETTTHVVPGDPADQIVATARQVGADLIVVGNKGMRGRQRILGSVPNEVAHKAHCSVLIVNTSGS
jgi:nucleotide-binding universal stress UspA family protein